MLNGIFTLTLCFKTVNISLRTMFLQGRKAVFSKPEENVNILPTSFASCFALLEVILQGEL